MLLLTPNFAKFVRSSVAVLVRLALKSSRAARVPELGEVRVRRLVHEEVRAAAELRAQAAVAAVAEDDDLAASPSLAQNLACLIPKLRLEREGMIIFQTNNQTTFCSIQFRKIYPTF